MSHGHGSRGPVGRVSGLPRVESADNISRVRSAGRVQSVTALGSRRPDQRTFAEALERSGRGLTRAEPLPAPDPRPLPPPVRFRGNEALEAPEPPPDSFLGLLWWKMKGPR